MIHFRYLLQDPFSDISLHRKIWISIIEFHKYSTDFHGIYIGESLSFSCEDQSPPVAPPIDSN